MKCALPFLFAAVLYAQSGCDLNSDGAVNVLDIQTEIDVALGLIACPVPSGGGGGASLPPLGYGLISAGGAIAINTTIAPTAPRIQSGVFTYCKASAQGGASAYACSLNAGMALTAYTEGMILLFNPNVNNLGSATLAIDSVGIVALVAKDGITQLTANQLVAGQAVLIWYDGKQFRLMY
jgi:hypothetical protein